MKILTLAVALLALAVPTAANAHPDGGAWWTTPRAVAALGTLKYKVKVRGELLVLSYSDRAYLEIRCKPLAPTKLTEYTGYVVAKHFRCEIWDGGGWGIRGPILRLHALAGNRFAVDVLWKPKNVVSADWRG